MPKAAIFIIEGAEEVEAVAPADIIRRGKVDVDMVAVGDDLMVKMSQGLEIRADKLLKDIDADDYDILVITGGTLAYLENKSFMDFIAKAGEGGQKRLAAICVAPVVLGELGLLKGKKATSYPGVEDRLKGANVVKDPVVTDGNITTSRSPGTAPLFGLEILKLLQGQEVSDTVRKGILIKDIVTAS
jgi:4-methyl-5(b-hydroxyethyl)-thiazole monophosphate biosynthesis